MDKNTYELDHWKLSILYKLRGLGLEIQIRQLNQNLDSNVVVWLETDSNQAV